MWDKNNTVLPALIPNAGRFGDIVHVELGEMLVDVGFSLLSRNLFVPHAEMTKFVEIEKGRAMKHGRPIPPATARRWNRASQLIEGSCYRPVWMRNVRSLPYTCAYKC